MKLDILTDCTAGAERCYRILVADGRTGALAWNGRGGFSLEAFGREWRVRQPDALERARQLGRGSRALLVDGFCAGRICTQREKDGLLGTCVFYELGWDVCAADGGEESGGSVRGYPNPGGGRGWRMSVYRDGRQVALAKRRSEPVHTPDGFSVVACDDGAAAAALLLVAYDVYASFLENDGGAAGPFAFREVDLFGTRARDLDDPLFEARCEGELSDDDTDGDQSGASGTAAPENAVDRAARISQSFSVKY